MKRAENKQTFNYKWSALQKICLNSRFRLLNSYYREFKEPKKLVKFQASIQISVTMTNPNAYRSKTFTHREYLEYSALELLLTFESEA